MKKLIPLIMLILTISPLFLSACTKTGNSTGIDLDTVVYLASSFEIENINISAVASDSDYLYALGDDISQSNITKISFGNNEQANISLDFLGSNQSVYDFALKANGNFLLLVSTWDNTGTVSNLIEISASGDLVSNTNLNDLLGLSGNVSTNKMYLDMDEMIYIIVPMNPATHIYVLKDNMEIANKFIDEDYLFNLVICADNNIYLHSSGDDGTVLKELDFESGAITKISFPDSIKYNNLIGFSSASDSGLLCADVSGIWEVDLASGSANAILNWLESSISVVRIYYFGSLKDGGYWAVRQMNNEGVHSAEVINLTPTTIREMPSRQYITYATGYLDSYILDTIVEFNKTNGKYHINVKEYFTGIDYGDTESLAAALIRFNMAISSANPPDLINIADINFPQLAAKGAFLDLNPLLEKSKIRHDDYHYLAFNGYNVMGNTYAVTPEFSIETLVGHESKLNNINSWSIPELIEWASKYPDAKLLRSYTNDILALLMSDDYHRFTDWQTGKCDFLNDDFISILEFAAANHTDDEENDRSSPHFIGMREGFKNNYYLLSHAFISSIDTFYEYDVMFDGEAKYICFPARDGSGFLARPAGATAISANSDNAEAAFAFISYLLSDIYQQTDKPRMFFIPVKNSALASFEKRLLTKTLIGDKRGTYEYGYGHEDMFVRIDFSRDDEYMEIYKDIISSTNSIKAADEQILLIISEEATGLLAGQKSAREVAGIIQNRVQVYMDENR
ncbi:MAG: extracellular solute-binding protein [Lachnospiraceae bacterium]|nr:extracellular solute-binding protein [Lachnospiraceae bacterium]